MCISDFMGTGLQLHVGSIVTSSNSELLDQKVERVWFVKRATQKARERQKNKLTTYFWMALRIPHMYWSTSRPSNNAVLLATKVISYDPLVANIISYRYI